MKIGICFGGYCPLHRGHLDLIMRAKKENDICYVISCGYDEEPRGLELGLSQHDRFLLIKEFFLGDETIRVLEANETDIGIDNKSHCSDEWAWELWTNHVLRLIWKDMSSVYPSKDYTFYVSEPEYKRYINSIIPGHGVVLMSKELNISGTLIRSNPLKYWSYIASTYRPKLTKKILITGTASEGKSTLVSDIKKYFNIPGPSEYGRTYMESKGLKDTDLGKMEFIDFLLGQSRDIINSLESPENSGVIISDTDNLVTLMYAKAYISDPDVPGITKDIYENELLPLAKSLPRIDWDMIFVLEPTDKTFVDDGLRYMKQSSIPEREKNITILKDLMIEFGYTNSNKIKYLNGTWYNNFTEVKKYIETLYK